MPPGVVVGYDRMGDRMGQRGVIGWVVRCSVDDEIPRKERVRGRFFVGSITWCTLKEIVTIHCTLARIVIVVVQHVLTRCRVHHAT